MPVGAIVGVVAVVLAVSAVVGMRPWQPMLATPTHVGATVGFARELASVKQELTYDHDYGEGWEWSAALSAVEHDLSTGLHNLLMRVCDELDVDPRDGLAMIVHDANMAPVLTAPEPTALARGATHG